MKKFLSAVLALTCVFSMSSMNISAEADTTILYGDANCDTDVDIRDIAALKGHLTGLKELSAKGLENCGFFNNTVSVKSLGQLTKYLIKEVDELQFSYYDDGVYDEYMPFNYVVLEENNLDSFLYITICIKHQYSQLHKIWNISELIDNSENIAEIVDLTNYTFATQKEEDNYLDSVEYRQILGIYLKNTDKAAIKKTITEIEQKNIKEIYQISISCATHGDFAEQG